MAQLGALEVQGPHSWRNTSSEVSTTRDGYGFIRTLQGNSILVGWALCFVLRQLFIIFLRGYSPTSSPEDS